MSKATPGEAVFLKVIIISALFVEVGYFYVFESDNYMIILKLKTRLKKDRLLTSVTIRMPEDVIDDLKQIAPVLGFSGYQPEDRMDINAARKALAEAGKKALWPGLG